ncbi:hypothetical protein SISSUDRAFT_1029672 [Sistotremastrum suecicum HHB10207 ss-3]|uniref:Uncharacterized protein n=1 Tax=Sistotremastrum suecicum HHB10207 ss-3 TaxID=1314776 RepID=A0A166I7J4_9AGAM|nr:hypothetical protein SISSUDRAFT_1029672 [Sistotremastrum suecicum HHB10207 ss-3]
MFNLFIALAASASFVSAQSLGSLGSCQGALTAILGNAQAASCLNIVGALPILQTTANQSLVDPLVTWASGLCAAAPCDNSTLSALTTNITTGCSSDLSRIDVSVDNVNEIITIVQEVYPTLRDILCLQDTSKNESCVNETLSDIQSAIGQPLSINAIIDFNTTLASISNPQALICTDCVQAAYDVALQNPLLASEKNGVVSVLSTECGSNFTSGSSPTDISTSAASAATSSQPTTNAGSRSKGELATSWSFATFLLFGFLQAL